MTSRMPAAGQTVSHYRVLGRIGAGGMGVVYRAEDLKLGRQVALKFLHEGADTDPDARARFRREARTASLLSHPNICTIFEIDEVDGKTFIAFELLDGDTLDRKISAGLSPREVIEIGIQTADAIDTAHGEGILHRDIKPANIYITRRGQVKVLDFGLAKPVSKGRAASVLEPSDMTRLDDIMTTSAGMAVGTIAYMSPEQARGETLDARSDLFSFGVVLYEMSTGQQTFKGSTSAVIFDAILNRDPVAPRQLNASIPDDLERIILKALEKDREMRYQSAADMRADLQRLKRSNESGRTSVSGLYASSGVPSASATQPLPSSATDMTVTMSSANASLSASAADRTVLAPAAIPTPPPAAAPPPAATPARASGGASSTSTLALAGAAVVVLAIGGFLWMRSSGPTTVDTTAASSAATAPEPPAPEVPAAAASPAAAPSVPEPSTPTPPSAGSSAARPTGTPPAPPAGATGGAKPTASKPAGTTAAPPAAAARPSTDAPAAAATDVSTELRVIADKVNARLYDQAAADLRALVTRMPNDVAALPAYFQLADVLERQGKADDAAATYSDVASRFPSHPQSIEARARLARAILKTNRRTRDQDARQVLAAIGSNLSGPALADALELKATIEQRLRLREMDPVLQTNAPSAVITLRSLVERVPDAPQVEEALQILSRVYEEMRRFEYAASAKVQLATKFPAKHAEEMWFEAGEMYERRTPRLDYARDAYANVPQNSRRYEEAQKRIQRIEKQLAR